MDDPLVSRVRGLFPCFSSVPDALWKHAELVSATPSTPHPVREGHLLEHALFIVSGGVRIFKICPESGREITLYRVFGGQCCALMMASILGETEYEASVSIEMPTEVLMISLPEFKNWIDEIRPVRQFVYKQIMGRIADVTTLIEKVAFQPIPVRLADFLLVRLSAREPATLEITHDLIAAELGTAREVVSRTLKAFAAQGAVLLQRGRITLLRRELLHRIAERLRD
ncbi:Crp/Fnr family transcriptional regulator [Cohnella herbarum]|uniref:Crp/Fnr family transcriptional regulator n=1 Tax=Cohnella herbarum TaxID=2728023 RepID=A0A7Z2VND0_9BACL|nr:Crp/Fnr family transcriptional regulator [Cohnella herbarum]QJD86493.1 Crp/Fnr family transcriptional regulator [Cohnella herbarum]